MTRSVTTCVRFGAVGVCVGLVQIGMAEQIEMSLPPQEESSVECSDLNVQIQYGQSATCSIISPPDLDTYLFDGIDGQVVRICVHQVGGGLDPRVELRDPNNKTIANEFCANFNCSLCFERTLQVTGEYRILISDVGNNDTGSYELQIELLGFDAIAVPFPYGHSITDSISPAVDQDFYTLDAVAGDLVWIGVHQVGGGLDPFIRMWNPGVTDVVYEDACANFNCSFGTQLLVIQETGVHLIELFDSGSNDTGTFQLQIERVPPMYPPVPVLIGDSLTTSIGLGVDTDFFSFDGVAGTEVRVSLFQTGGGLDPRLRIWDPNMMPIVDALGCNNFNCNTSQDLMLTETGTYLMALWDAGRNDTGSCQIAIQCLFGNCTCAQNDIDGDGQVGILDFLTLLADWGDCAEPCNPGCVNDPDTCSSDVDRDCTVGIGDFLRVLGSWGNCQ